MSEIKYGSWGDELEKENVEYEKKNKENIKISVAPSFVTWKPECCKGCKFDKGDEYLTLYCTYPYRTEWDGDKCLTRKDIGGAK